MSEMRIDGRAAVTCGADIFLEEHLDLVSGARLGLITNPAGVNRDMIPLIDRFRGHPRIHLTALFGPEHGVRGDAEAGEFVPFSTDPVTGLPVYSLYGQERAGGPDPGVGRDEIMRTYDIREEGKAPEDAALHDLDVLALDLQDVGTRVYTYLATMAYAMRACARRGLRLLVLDRPNPLNGIAMEGPVLDYPEFSSFVGIYPIPLRHGLTLGELARLFNARFLTEKCDLHVIPMQGWRRSMWYDQTGLAWISPSPNLPTLETAVVYPGQVFWEGTNVSEGRGTTQPFLQCGAPWIDGHRIAEHLNRMELPGIRFREVWFRPAWSKYAGEPCSGARLHVTERNRYRPLEVTLHIIQLLLDLYPERFRFYPEYFDRIMGTDKVREALNERVAVREIVAGFRDDLIRFADLRKPHLLYD